MPLRADNERIKPILELEIRRGDVVFLDLDRTTIQSDNLSKFAYNQLRNQYDPKNASNQDEYDENLDILAKIHEIQDKERDNKGNAYEYLKLLHDAGAEFDPVQLAKQVVDSNRDEYFRVRPEFIKTILNDGATELIHLIQQKGGDVVFMTAGDELTQRFKIEIVQQLLAEIEIEVAGWIITQEKKVSKTTIIDSLYDVDAERYVFEEALLGQNQKVIASSFSPRLKDADFDRATLLDDKLKHLSGAREIAKSLDIVWQEQGRALRQTRHYRTILMYAAGRKSDGLPRATIPDVIDAIEARKAA